MSSMTLEVAIGNKDGNRFGASTFTSNATTHTIGIESGGSTYAETYQTFSTHDLSLETLIKNAAVEVRSVTGGVSSGDVIGHLSGIAHENPWVVPTNSTEFDTDVSSTLGKDNRREWFTKTNTNDTQIIFDEITALLQQWTHFDSERDDVIAVYMYKYYGGTEITQVFASFEHATYAPPKLVIEYYVEDVDDIACGLVQFGGSSDSYVHMPQHTSSTYTEFCKIDADAFVGTGKYLLVVCARMLNTVSTVTNWCRTTYDGTAFTDSEYRNKASLVSPVDKYMYYWWIDVYDQPATPVDIGFELKESASSVIYLESVQMFWMRLDDDLVQGTDWDYFEDSSGPTAHTTSFADRGAGLTFTPGDATSDWLLLAFVKWDANTMSSNAESRFLVDGTSPFGWDISEEAVNTAAKYTVGHAWVEEALSQASHTFKIQTRDDATATWNEYQACKIFALRLDSFESHSVFKDAGPTNATTSFVSQVSGTHTPATSGRQIVITDLMYDINSIDNKPAIKRIIDGTTTPPEDGTFEQQARDSTNRQGGPGLLMAYIDTGGAVIDVQGKAASTTSTPQFDEGLIVAFSAQLEPGAPPAPASSQGWGAVQLSS